MAHTGQVIEGQNGFRLLLVKTAADTGGELLEMEVTYGGDGQLPPEHMHPRQLERFEVLEGAVRTVIDRVEARYEAGESFEVPAGTRHQMAGDGPARLRWRVTPALKTAEFFELLNSGNAGPDFLERFSDEFRLTAV